MTALLDILPGVVGLADDSRKVKKGYVFFALHGSQKDGTAYVKQAIENGASYIVSEQDALPELADKWIKVEDAKTARVDAARMFYKNPFEKIQVHGVTGTSGKTTTVFLMESMLLAQGEKVALLGTVHKRIGANVAPSDLTTPGVLELYAFAAEAVKAGCKHLVMEVSSHALDQGRVEGVSFTSGLFSNLSRDHLDYHVTMDQYFEAKKLLFTKYCPTHKLVNIDDTYGAKIASEDKSVVKVSRLSSAADIYPIELQLSGSGLQFCLPGCSPVIFKTHLTGEFNVDNVLLACAWATSIGLSIEAIQKGLNEVKVPGRFELAFCDGGRHVVVDYAHKPDALERVLQTARKLCKRKLVVVFGCGGDRDRGKRPIMGSIAEKYADMCFVTSDNPRTEDPMAIIQEILVGMQKNNHAVIEDRKLAIHSACRTLDGEDWLVVAGKGHEDYQIIGTTKHPFDDRKVVREAFGLC